MKIYTNEILEGRKQIIEAIKQNPEMASKLSNLAPQWKKWFEAYAEGKATLPFTYDLFFKYIFDPINKKERLERFIAEILGCEKVTIKCVFPVEGRSFNLEGRLPILDIIVELSDGSLVNVEIQKISYLFPAERMSCYSSDLVIRQYLRKKNLDEKGFVFKDMSKVYTIVIYENAPEEFRKDTKNYRHYGKTTFDTGVKIELLQEYCIIVLDIFKKYHYNEDTKLNGWLSFLTTETVEEAEELVVRYPWLAGVYNDAMELELDKEVMSNMFSEALYEIDRNTTKYMIDLLKEENAAVKQEAAAIKEENQEKSDRIAELEKYIKQLKEENGLD